MRRPRNIPDSVLDYILDLEKKQAEMIHVIKNYRRKIESIRIENSELKEQLKRRK